ncbi:MAG: aspartate-semialdehyde dehydrogenase [Clostridia bacterium]|nr:aspartate-semialdehyde dehydrogenase [Clostridia bacterium]
MKRFNLALVGATGLVGQEFLKILQEEGFDDRFLITPFSSSEGEIKIFGKSQKLFRLQENMDFSKFDFAIFSAGDDISRKFAPMFKDGGAIVIDNSNAFRRDKDVPLVVPEINFGEVKSKKIISNPNCSTIQLVLVLNQILKVLEIKKVVVSSYQSVSGAGKEALGDLFYGTRTVFKNGISQNIVAEIGSILNNGYCTEEDKIMFESQKILNKNFEIYASTVRVPVPFCHTESVYVETEEKIDDAKFLEIKKLLNTRELFYTNETIFPNELRGKNETCIFRMRKAGTNGLNFFVVADNLRRGAAFNAFLILKKILK